MAPGGTGNAILDRLPQRELQALLPRAREVRLERHTELAREGAELTAAFFPITAVCSVLVATGDGSAVEAATIGREGVVGLPIHFGLRRSPYRVVAQIPGTAIRTSAADLVRATRGESSLEGVVRCYAAYALRSAHQAVACNARHSVEERAARWLLLTHDRTGSDELPLTHEFLAEMLGVRRQTVSLAAAALQRAGLIEYRRASVQVVDRPGLEAVSCECYGVMRRFEEELIG